MQPVTTIPMNQVLFPMRKQELKEVKLLAQVHGNSKQQNRYSCMTYQKGTELEDLSNTTVVKKPPTPVYHTKNLKKINGQESVHVSYLPSSYLLLKYF